MAYETLTTQLSEYEVSLDTELVRKLTEVGAALDADPKYAGFMKSD